MAKKADWQKLNLPESVQQVLRQSPLVQVAWSVEDLVNLACGGVQSDSLSVEYVMPNGRPIPEATVARVRNGIVANYYEPYMRRRDPECMVIADDFPTDKIRFEDRFGRPFEEVRQETLDWLGQQELALFAFETGLSGMGYQAVAMVPLNAAFFAMGLALLQGILSADQLPKDFNPQAVIYVAPIFRHTLFEGKQLVVHQRNQGLYEMFAYNLYPGPSAKKGVYGMLIGQGEKEGWLTLHCSTVQVVTPYDNITTIMHEGASGGGKSEMLEQAHRQHDGRLLIGENLVTRERRFLEIPRTCDLQPVNDDMALCHPSLQQDDGRMHVVDAENAWFVRVDHLTEYGTDIALEKLTARPPEPLLFLNIDAVPGSRALVWEHKMDTPDTPCPNPRVIIPRAIVPNVVNQPAKIDIRSMGVRTPPCTREKPTYGIIGMLHVLPPALAWLWRLVSPRGYANPSIVDSKGLGSEGVGSYWPFATGRKVTQANLLLEQIKTTTKIRYVLIPNQHIGAWKTGFMPQWIAREWLARRGSARFQPSQIVPARCSLLGYAIYTMRVEGTQLPHWLLEVNSQPEVGDDGYDRGAQILEQFFTSMITEFLEEELDPMGKDIIRCCLDHGTVSDYEAFIPRE